MPITYPARLENKHHPLDAAMIVLLFAAMGGFFWAIRGTGGYGGAAGGVLAGLGWAMIWLLLYNRNGQMRERPFGNGYMVAALTLGMGVGGMTGYGVYISWLDGYFHLDYPDGVRSVAPWTGYAMLFVCGLHWGGVAGAFMAWCAPKNPLSPWEWCARVGCGIVGAALAWGIVVQFPQWFLPFYSEGIYAIKENATCIRALESAKTIAPHVGLFFGFLLFETFRRDFRAVAIMLIMGLGFALSFSIGGIWQTNNDTAPHGGWWKLWEMTIGIGGGVSIASVFLLFNLPETQSSEVATRREKVFASALVMVLTIMLIVSNFYQGFSELHALDWPRSIRTGLEITTLAVLSLGFFLCFRSSASEDEGIGSLMPQWAPIFTLLLIVVAGFLLSIPSELQYANRLILTLYVIFIGLSLLSSTVLFVRSRE